MNKIEEGIKQFTNNKVIYYDIRENGAIIFKTQEEGYFYIRNGKNIFRNFTNNKVIEYNIRNNRELIFKTQEEGYFYIRNGKNILKYLTNAKVLQFESYYNELKFLTYGREIIIGEELTEAQYFMIMWKKLLGILRIFAIIIIIIIICFFYMKNYLYLI